MASICSLGGDVTAAESGIWAGAKDMRKLGNLERIRAASTDPPLNSARAGELGEARPP